MVRRKSGIDRAVGELADLTGRSDAEVKLLLGGVVAVGGLILVLRTMQGLSQLGATFARRG